MLYPNSGSEELDRSEDMISVPSLEETETVVCAIWKATLGVPCIGLDDSIFELGASSLAATALLARINQTFEQQLPISAIFELSTVRAIAAWLYNREALGRDPKVISEWQE